MGDHPASMESKIYEWLTSQGYPLEMYVSRSFIQSGFRVIQSDYFDDAESGDSRELDVRASVQESIGDVLFRISFAVECKATPGKPWVLFTSKSRIADPARVAQRGCSEIARKLQDTLAHSKDIQSLPLFQIPDRAAYSITQAFTSGHDVAYDAAMSVSKAAGSLIRDANKYTSIGHPIALLTFPVIVVDAPVVEAYLDEHGEMIVSAVDSGVLIWRNPVMHNLLNMISIVQCDGIESFATTMRASCQAVMEFARSEIPKLPLIEQKPK